MLTIGRPREFEDSLRGKVCDLAAGGAVERLNPYVVTTVTANGIGEGPAIWRELEIGSHTRSERHARIGSDQAQWVARAQADQSDPFPILS